MGSNIRDFQIGLDRFVEDIDVNVGRLHRAVALEGLAGVVRMTPVDEGRARGAWTVSHGSPDFAEPGTLDTRGGATIARGGTAIAAAEPYSEMHIVNAVPYIEELENGSSQQAPNGMLNVTFNRLNAWLQRRR